MAPTRPRPLRSPKQLLQDAIAKLEQGDALAAAALAKDALTATGEDGDRAGAACALLGEIYVELGEIEKARSFFLRAAEVDKEGTLPEELGGGPEKFLWLAQLSEDGGQDSVSWFERGTAALRHQIQAATEALAETRRKGGPKSVEEALGAREDEKKRKLAETLCAVAEVYMTDLSWEADAEARCEALVTEATMVAPELPDAWQTVANVRISQTKVDEAKAALERSLALWEDLPPEHPSVPAFATRVGLVRLLLEVEDEDKAIEVVERLLAEDDESVEAWYLGGLGLFTTGEKAKAKDVGDKWKSHWRAARQSLNQCLRLFQLQEYEDDRLGDHAKELLESIAKELGPAPADGEEDDDGWEDTDGDEDDEDEDMED
ncbi:putative tpr domain-containing protein [Phaeoacremonium minimum UCRPA7]|uniref:Putative tpr domain-containing protein n=1 Tax=Phaeoacremonium minimum (strain UCR-PA7) TaxID=1286976 RepID=R8BBY1_PHAM7|nr:putative tpr domain-containing protein [Phaeoacremonium minimum UCRPA7]EON96808.1 putative tpr domain-containing protein [Phaeoacremonium minimum UCRPA7]